MRLDELIEALEAAPQDKVCASGFGKPSSYRGYYEQLAFEPAREVTVASMLAHARSALGQTYTGYKGGSYRMDGSAVVNIAAYSECNEDDEITPERLLRILGTGSPVESPIALSDYETIKALLTKAGIFFKEETPDHNPPDHNTVIVVPERTLDEGTNRGYNGFVSEFYFKDGNLVAMGAWE